MVRTLLRVNTSLFVSWCVWYKTQKCQRIKWDYFQCLIRESVKFWSAEMYTEARHGIRPAIISAECYLGKYIIPNTNVNVKNKYIWMYTVVWRQIPLDRTFCTGEKKRREIKLSKLVTSKMIINYSFKHISRQVVLKKQLVRASISPRVAPWYCALATISTYLYARLPPPLIKRIKTPTHSHACIIRSKVWYANPLPPRPPPPKINRADAKKDC